jgi:hypothetical protein
MQEGSSTGYHADNEHVSPKTMPLRRTRGTSTNGTNGGSVSGSSKPTIYNAAPSQYMGSSLFRKR